MPAATTDDVVLFADAQLLVAEKPAGLLSVPGRGEAGRDNLVALLQGPYADLQVVHRLDMATSGLMVFARGAAMQRMLSRAFAERAVHKRYLAVVDGLVAGDAGEVDAKLAADWPNRPRQQVDAVHGKASLTRWRVLGRDAAARRTALELEPVTGRTHQLRLHLAHIGHAIVGDALYAAPAIAAAAPRLLLHAHRLAFTHPASGAALAFTSPVPFTLP